jgi:hypothetical protein
LLVGFQGQILGDEEITLLAKTFDRDNNGLFDKVLS